MDPDERARREAIVLRDYGGILPYTEIFYILSIIHAAEALFVAYARYQHHLEDRAEDEAAAAIHEALSHAAALSRFFWPSKKTKLASARAQKLRAAFALGDESALRSRDLRNALEHYDERLDDFLLGNVVGGILPTPILADVSLNEDPAGHVFKLLDPDRSIFVLLGTAFHFAPIIEEAGRILETGYDLDRGGRLLVAGSPDADRDVDGK